MSVSLEQSRAGFMRIDNAKFSSRREQSSVLLLSRDPILDPRSRTDATKRRRTIAIAHIAIWRRVSIAFHFVSRSYHLVARAPRSESQAGANFRLCEPRFKSASAVLVVDEPSHFSAQPSILAGPRFDIGRHCRVATVDTDYRFSSFLYALGGCRFVGVAARNQTLRVSIAPQQIVARSSRIYA